METDARDVRPGEQLDWARLAAWLRERLPACQIPGLDVSHEPRVAQFPDNYDMISTGSIKKTDVGKTYSIRRSVTQPMPEMPCVVTGYSNEGGC